MLSGLSRAMVTRFLPDVEQQKVDTAFRHLNSVGYDNWGADPETCKAALTLVRWLYYKYFRVGVQGIENIPQGRVLLIANHSGQLPLDGLMISLSLMLESDPPRLVRTMVERWATSLPFISTFFSRAGQLVGDHHNCRDLLEHEECVLVFPEGVGGSGKTIRHRYELQRFGTGFMRLALETKTPIVPVAVVGCEEIYPSLFNFSWLAKLIRAPYVPITPLFPALGPLGLVPLPCKISIRFGKPMFFEGDPDKLSDRQVEPMVDEVKKGIRHELKQGLKNRDGRIFRNPDLNENGHSFKA